MITRRSFFIPLLAAAVAGMTASRAAAGDWEPMPAKNPPPDRYRVYHELVAKGPHAKVVAATCFGGPGHEEFLDAGELPDGTLVLFGNAWGPAFPDKPAPAVLGKGSHRGLKPTKAAPKSTAETPAPEDPDCAGFIVFSEPGLKAVRRVVKFDWGVASLTAGAALPDGKGLVVSGRCTGSFRDLKAGAGSFQIQPGGGGAYTYEGAACPGDVYVARLAPGGAQIEWIWVIEAANDPPDRLFIDKGQNVYFDSKGLKRIDADGKAIKALSDKTHTGTARWHFVDPEGNAYWGGDRNTHTNKEPWRQPYLYKYNPAGERVWALWEFPPKDMGADRAGLQADSSVRGVAATADGQLLVSGWSDGGNSVFQRQATDWKKNCPDSPLGWSPWWPKGANSFGHVMLLDPEKKETRWHLWWCCYLPMNFGGGPGFYNRTGGGGIRQIAAHPGGAVVFTGNSGTGLIQTPNAFWKDPGKGEKYGGETAVILPKDVHTLLFSSYLPGLQNARPAITKKGALVVSRSAGHDGREPKTDSPAVNALQPFGGGTDGHVILFDLPAGGS
jgi:hypothetical protein